MGAVFRVKMIAGDVDEKLKKNKIQRKVCCCDDTPTGNNEFDDILDYKRNGFESL